MSALNFLLHYDMATRELSANDVGAAQVRVVGVGAMWPDLARMAGHVVRSSKTAETAIPEDESDAAFARGMAHHFSADAWFHRTEVFRVGERNLSRAFLATDTPKLVLFAHAAWEMCLDGALLRARGGELRDEVARAARESVTSLRRAAHTLVAEPSERTTLDARVDRMHAALASGALYDDYATSEGIARRLSGIRQMFRFDRPDPPRLARWTTALDAAADAATEALPALFQDREAHLLQKVAS